MEEYAYYRRLWSAVVIQALKDMRYSSKGVDNKESPLVIMNRAKIWVEETDPVYTKAIGSFEWICSMLDLDARRIRRLSRTRAGLEYMLDERKVFARRRDL